MGLPRRYAPRNDEKECGARNDRERVRGVLAYFYNFTTSYNISYV